MAQPTHQDPSPESLTKGYEPSRLRPRWFVVAVVGFVAFAAVTHVLLWYLVKYDANPRPAVDRPISTLAGNDLPPKQSPPLQPTPNHDRVPKEDLESMYRGEDHVFAALGWRVDKTSHRVTPPDQLVRLVADRYRSHTPRATSAPSIPTPTTRAITPIPGTDQGGNP
jgi:hypothetical protein